MLHILTSKAHVPAFLWSHSQSCTEGGARVFSLIQLSFQLSACSLYKKLPLLPSQPGGDSADFLCALRTFGHDVVAVKAWLSPGKCSTEAGPYHCPLLPLGYAVPCHSQCLLGFPPPLGWAVTLLRCCDQASFWAPGPIHRGAPAPPLSLDNLAH